MVESRDSFASANGGILHFDECNDWSMNKDDNPCFNEENIQTDTVEKKRKKRARRRASLSAKSYNNNINQPASEKLSPVEENTLVPSSSISSTNVIKKTLSTKKTKEEMLKKLYVHNTELEEECFTNSEQKGRLLSNIMTKVDILEVHKELDKTICFEKPIGLIDFNITRAKRIITEKQARSNKFNDSFVLALLSVSFSILEEKEVEELCTFIMKPLNAESAKAVPLVVDDTTKSNIKNDGNKKSKCVRFNSIDGSNTSPPNDRSQFSWFEIMSKAKELKELLFIVEFIGNSCLRYSEKLFVALVKSLVYLQDMSNVMGATNKFNSLLEMKVSSTEITSSVDVLLPDLCLLSLKGMLANSKISFVGITTLLRYRFSWMISSVVRAQLRWLLDIPPPCISNPTHRSISNPTQTHEELYHDYRSHCWSSINVDFEEVPQVFDSISSNSTEKKISVTGSAKQKLSKYLYEVEKTYLPEDGANLSYLFTCALRQILVPIVIYGCKSQKSDPFANIAAILDCNIKQKQSKLQFALNLPPTTDMSIEERGEFSQIILGAEAGRLFIKSMFEVIPGIKDTTIDISEVSKSRKTKKKSNMQNIWVEIQNTTKELIGLDLGEEVHLLLLSKGMKGLCNLIFNDYFISSESLNICKVNLCALYEKYQSESSRARTIAAKAQCNRILESLEEDKPILRFPKLTLIDETG